MEGPVAGHNKWSQIKRKKAVNDQRRGKIFTKLIRELTVAAREGGSDPAANARLRLAIDGARSANMPQANIDRAIKRGSGELEGVVYEEIAYEGYGPGGAALYIETLTDNAKRTVAQVRHILDKNGGNLGAAGSVAWQFERRGMILVEGSGLREDDLFEAALEAGAEDVEERDGDYLVLTDPALLSAACDALKGRGISFALAQRTMMPKSEVPISASEEAKLARLLDALDDQDDVQQVHSNATLRAEQSTARSAGPA